MRIVLIPWHEVAWFRKLDKTGPATKNTWTKAGVGTGQGPEALCFRLALPWASYDLRKTLALDRNYLCLHNGCTKASSGRVWGRCLGEAIGEVCRALLLYAVLRRKQRWASRDLALLVLSLHIWKCFSSPVASSFWGFMGDPQGLGLGGHEPGLSDLEAGTHLGALSAYPSWDLTFQTPPTYLSPYAFLWGASVSLLHN